MKRRTRRPSCSCAAALPTSRGSLTILAESAKPLEELNAAQLAQEIQNAEEDLADATSETAKKQASEKIDQLKELQAALAA